LFAGEMTNAGPEEGAIHCYDLRDIGDGIFGEPSRTRLQKDVAGRDGTFEPRAQNDAYCGRKPAAIERVSLNDNDRMAITRRRAFGSGKVHPEDIALCEGA